MPKIAAGLRPAGTAPVSAIVALSSVSGLVCGRENCRERLAAVRGLRRSAEGGRVGPVTQARSDFSCHEGMLGRATAKVKEGTAGGRRASRLVKITTGRARGLATGRDLSVSGRRRGVKGRDAGAGRGAEACGGHLHFGVCILAARGPTASLPYT